MKFVNVEEWTDCVFLVNDFVSSVRGQYRFALAKTVFYICEFVFILVYLAGSLNNRCAFGGVAFKAADTTHFVNQVILPKTLTWEAILLTTNACSTFLRIII